MSRYRWSLLPSARRSPAERPNRACRPCLEALEDRLAPATHTWTGPAGGRWSNAANWSGGVPTNNELGGTFVQFNGNSDSTDDIANLQVNGINFTAGNNIVRGTTSLSISDSGGTGLVSASGTNTLDSTLTLSLFGGFSQGFAARINAGQLTVAGSVNGFNGLNKQGGGTLLLSGSNSFSGGTALTVSAGTLQAGSASAFGPSSFFPHPAVVLANAAGTFLDLNNFNVSVGSLAGAGVVGGQVLLGSGTLTVGDDNTSTTFNGWFSGTGGLTKVGSGTLLLTGTSTYTGRTFINAGTLRFGTDGAMNAGFVLGGSIVTVQNNATLDLNNHSVTIEGLNSTVNATITLGSGTLTVGFVGGAIFGTISGTGGLTVSSTFQNLFLRGNNTYSGTTIINSNGGLDVGGGGTTGTLGTGPVTNNGTLVLDRSDTITVSNAITGGGNLTQAGTGTTTLTGAAAFTGPIVINAGTLMGTLGTGPVTNNSALAFNPSGTVTVTNSISGTGRITQSGSGIVVLSGTNNYSGPTAINAGTLRAGSASALSPASAVVLASSGGAALDLNGFSATVGSLAGGGTVILGSGTLSAGGDNTSTAFGGTITGGGGLTKQGNGTLTLTGTGSYNGATTINGGMLQVGNGGTTGTLGAGAVTNNGHLAFNRSDAVSVANAIGGSGMLVQAGTGTLTPTNVNNSYGGGTMITNGGTLQTDDDRKLGAASGGLFLGGGMLRTLTNSITSNRPVTVMAASVLDIAPGTTFALSGNIAGSSNLAKMNTGNLTLAGSGTYSGTLTFADGSLLLNGSEPNAAVRVNHATVVAGTGAIGALSSSESGAILRPGSSAATGNGAGTLSIGPGSNLTGFTYEADLTSSAAGQFDTLQVNGDVDLGGATLNPRVSSAFANSLPAGGSVALVQSTGTLRGTFKNLPDNSPLTVTVGGQPQVYAVNYNLVKSEATIGSILLNLALSLAPFGEDSAVGTLAGTLSLSTALPVQLDSTTFSLPAEQPDNSQFKSGPTRLSGVNASADLRTNASLNQLSYTILAQANWAQYVVQSRFTLQADPPLTVTIKPEDGQLDPSGGPAIHFTVHFSAPVGDFNAGDVDLRQSTAGSLQADVSGSGQDYTVTVRGMSQPGTVMATIPAGLVHDSGGNPNHAASAAATVTYNPTAPPGRLYDAAQAFARSPEHYTQFVTTEYRQFLKREPDPAGLQGWVNGMLAGVYTDERVEGNFINSVEYVTAHNGTGRDWLLGIYHDLLGRTNVGDDEINGWLGLMAAGMSPTTVAADIAGSIERETQRVRADYQTYLGHDGPPDQVAGWVAAFAQGTTNEDIIHGFVGSPEYYYRPDRGADDPATWIRRAYLDVLFRAPSDGEVNNWLQFLLS
jgi:autotransporter-associated beta strand protein